MCSPRGEASQGQLGPFRRGETGLTGHSHCLLTKVVAVGWGGVEIDTDGRWMAGGPVPELRETQAHCPCCQAPGHFPISAQNFWCSEVNGDSWS